MRISVMETVISMAVNFVLFLMGEFVKSYSQTNGCVS